MTREVAIEIIQKLIGRFKSDSRTYKALEMAIQALSQEPTNTWSIKDVADTFKKHGLIREQEPCDDAISREAVIRLIRNENSALKDIFITHSAGEELSRQINELPTVCDIDAIRREIEDLYIITNPASNPYDGGYYTALIDVRRIIDKHMRGEHDAT